MSGIAMRLAPLPPTRHRRWSARLALALVLTSPVALAGHPAGPAVLAYLQDQATTLPVAVQIDINPATLDRLAPCDAVAVFANRATPLRKRMSVGVRCLQPDTWSAYVQATVSAPGTYPVTSRNIAADTVISPDDITLQEGDLLALPRNAALEAGEVIGAIATRRLRAGQPLRHNALRNAQSIKRGQTVKLVVHGAGFVATSDGQAMTSAAPGAVIQVRTASGHRTSGIVRDANTVEIPM